MEIRKFLGKTLLLIGIFIFFYSLFGFSSSCGNDLYEIMLDCENRPIRYFYTESSRIGIGLGAIFLLLGTLLIKK